MNIALELFLIFLAGLGAGCFYFGGLLLTVKRLQFVQKPGYLLMGSFALRAGLTFALFFRISDGRLLRLLACALGFFCARQMMIRYWRPAVSREAHNIGVEKWNS